MARYLCNGTSDYLFLYNGTALVYLYVYGTTLYLLVSLLSAMAHQQPVSTTHADATIERGCWGN
jgi:hypothetical protein